MNDPVLFPDNKIEYSPTELGSPSEFRGKDGDGWPVGEDDGAFVVFDLTNKDGNGPSLLQEMRFFGDNTKTVDVLVQDEPNGDFKRYKDEPIDVSEGPLSFADGIKRGIYVYRLKIVLLTTRKRDLPFDVRFEVVACIKGR